MTLAIIELDARADGELRKRTVDVERIPEMARFKVGDTVFLIGHGGQIGETKNPFKVLKVDASDPKGVQYYIVDQKDGGEMWMGEWSLGSHPKELRSAKASASAYSAKLDKCITLLGRAVERKAGRKYASFEDVWAVVRKLRDELSFAVDTGTTKQTVDKAQQIIDTLRAGKSGVR